MLDEKKLQELLAVQKEIAGFLAILVKRDKTQSDVTLELHKVGFTPKRIAELLDTTSNSIRVNLNRIKNKK